MIPSHKQAYRRLRIEPLEARIALTATNIGFGNNALNVTMDGNKWVLANSNHSTTSHAAGLNEASFTNARAVTTLNGGTISSTLSDAFDGVMNFGLANGSTFSQTTYYDADGIVDVSTDGAGNKIVTEDPNTVGTNGASFGGVSISQQIFFAAHAPMARFVWTISNPTASPITQKYGEFNNLGSDNNTRYVLSSSGGTVPSNSDTWWTSFQNYSGTTSTDPRLLFVNQGPGAVAVPHQFLNPQPANGTGFTYDG